MASKSGQRVRLVKCPKCLKILQEDEDVPVYQCGGCSAILQAKRRNIAPKPTPSAGETEGDKASEPPNTVTSAEETERAQASDHPNIAPSAGDSERAQESEPPNTGPSAGETEEAQASEPPIEGEREGTQASEPPIEPETNNVSSSAGQDTVLPLPTGHSSCQEDEKAGGGSMDSTEKKIGGLALSQREETNEIQLHEDSDKNEVEDNSSRFKSDIESVVEATRSGTSSGQDTVLQLHTGCSSVQEDDKDQDGSMESTEKQLGGLELSKGDESNERSLGDSDKNEGGDNSSRLKSDMESVVEATQPGTSSGSLNADHVVDARASNSSSEAYHNLVAEISPNASPVEEGQDVFQPHRESTDDLPANKTSSAYDGSKSSSDEREDQYENQQWNALQNRFDMQRYPQNFKEQGGSSSSTFSDRRPSQTTTYNKQYQNRSLQLEGPGGRLGRQGRRHVSEQLRPDVPLYPREPYSHVSPPYPPHDVFDSYSRLNSLHMAPYAGGMNYEGVDHMYHNNTRARDRGQGSWYSGQMYSSYSSYSASPQRLMEQQPEYYPRWSHEIVSDAEDHQRTRHTDLQPRRRQPVAKRHVRPTAGGAPFVICYRCSQNLQIPVDFLIFKRKYHLLRCGKCTTVLRFSLQSRTHLVPAATHDIDANRTSNSTSDSPRDKAEKPSSSIAQEDEEEEVPVAARGGSPLHRLMGYSTVSQVFKASQRPPSV